MRVQINGNEQMVADNLTITRLLKQLGLSQQKIAVEVNQQIIPASEHPHARLAEHDSIEIIHAVGGG